jgi:hypothetical protein
MNVFCGVFYSPSKKMSAVQFLSLMVLFPQRQHKIIAIKHYCRIAGFYSFAGNIPEKYPMAVFYR